LRLEGKPIRRCVITGGRGAALVAAAFTPTTGTGAAATVGEIAGGTSNPTPITQVNSRTSSPDAMRLP
jgi:hypothetical protein